MSTHGVASSPPHALANNDFYLTEEDRVAKRAHVIDCDVEHITVFSGASESVLEANGLPALKSLYSYESASGIFTFRVVGQTAPVLLSLYRPSADPATATHVANTNGQPPPSLVSGYHQPPPSAHHAGRMGMISAGQMANVKLSYSTANQSSPVVQPGLPLNPQGTGAYAASSGFYVPSGGYGAPPPPPQQSYHQQACPQQSYQHHQYSPSTPLLSYSHGSGSSGHGGSYGGSNGGGIGTQPGSYPASTATVFPKKKVTGAGQATRAKKGVVNTVNKLSFTAVLVPICSTCASNLTRPIMMTRGPENDPTYLTEILRIGFTNGDTSTFEDNDTISVGFRTFAQDEDGGKCHEMDFSGKFGSKNEPAFDTVLALVNGTGFNNWIFIMCKELDERSDAYWNSQESAGAKAEAKRAAKTLSGMQVRPCYAMFVSAI
jgi:hypothetical protein